VQGNMRENNIKVEIEETASSTFVCTENNLPKWNLKKFISRNT
jgi:hypothetical protein